jgi:hypothetical protein
LDVLPRFKDYRFWPRERITESDGRGGLQSTAATKAVAAGLQTTGARVSALAQDVGETVSSAASNATGSAEAVESNSPISVESDATPKSRDDFLRSARNTLSAALERQPLLLGAIGVAIGAGIGSMFASTQTENELLGATGTAVKDKVQSMASDVVGATGEAIDRMATEANTQGLTPSAFKAQAKAAGDKLKAVGGAARKSVNARLS